jgi:hypothetical protein
VLTANIAVLLLGLLLTTWGASLVLRAVASKVAVWRTRPPFAAMFRGSSPWDPKPDRIRRVRASVTAVFGLIATLAGAACFGIRPALAPGSSPSWQDIAGATFAGVTCCAALAAFALGLFADRAAGRQRCSRCWYDMVGQPSLRCPECGHVTRSARELQRTRRSGTMLIVALLLLAMTMTPRLVIGFRAQGLMGATPTWAMITFIDHIPTAWVTPPVSDERFGTLQDRLERLSPIERAMLIRRVRLDLASDYSVLFSRSTPPPTSNLGILRGAEPSLDGAALSSRAARDHLRHRYNALARTPPAQLSNREIEELGFITMQLFDQRSPASLAARAPLSAVLMERVAAMDIGRTGSDSWYAFGISNAVFDDPHEALLALLRRLDNPQPRCPSSYDIARLIGDVVHNAPQERATLQAYVRMAGPVSLTAILTMQSSSRASDVLEPDTIAAFRSHPDVRVQAAAWLVTLPGELASRDICPHMIACYNASHGPDRTLQYRLTQFMCSIDAAMPGLLRDLRSGDDDAVSETIDLLLTSNTCDPALGPPLRELLARGRLIDVLGATELLLRVDPTFDPTTFGTASPVPAPTP